MVNIVVIGLGYVGLPLALALAGRRINDGMGTFLGQKVVKLLFQADEHVKGARVGILGLPFKENVRDIRNSKVPDILAELPHLGIEAEVHDPIADRVRPWRSMVWRCIPGSTCGIWMRWSWPCPTSTTSRWERRSCYPACAQGASSWT